MLEDGITFGIAVEEGNRRNSMSHRSLEGHAFQFSIKYNTLANHE